VGYQRFSPALVAFTATSSPFTAKSPVAFPTTIKLAALPEFIANSPETESEDEALRLAANLWAKSRQGGHPIADPQALDIDVIIAAQALSSGFTPNDITIVTSNPRHLSPFITAKSWNQKVL